MHRIRHAEYSSDLSVTLITLLAGLSSLPPGRNGCSSLMNMFLSFPKVCSFSKEEEIQQREQSNGKSSRLKDLPLCWFTSQMAMMANAGSGRNHEFLPGLHMGSRDPRTLVMLHCYSQAIKSWIRSMAAGT